MTVTAHRLPQNPLLTPDDVPPLHEGWKVVCAFNAAATTFGGETLLLLRVAERPEHAVPQPGDKEIDLSGDAPRLKPVDPALAPDDYIATPMLDDGGERRVVVRYIRRDTQGLDTSDTRLVTKGTWTYLTSISSFRLARSTDGVHFSVERDAAMRPTEPLERYGIEDPRITAINDVYYINYTAVSEHGVSTALARTRDFQRYERLGVIFPPENRDVAIFPAKIGGRYRALHRPVPKMMGDPAVWFASSDNLTDWGEHRFCFGSRPGTWDSRRIGGGAVPFLTARGWLEVYHGVNPDGHYALGAALLDSDRPWQVVARSAEPILRPEVPFETDGFFGNVVFTCGCILDGDRLRVYYGAADMVTAAADYSLEEVLGSLKEE
jgi:beta-1,2-mannobiose phosphorylase / 1,2-beta-oligomannan phosphorylase